MGELYDAINKLPDQAKKVIILSYLEGKSNQEIADALQINLQTVKNYKQFKLVSGFWLWKDEVKARDEELEQIFKDINQFHMEEEGQEEEAPQGPTIIQRKGARGKKSSRDSQAYSNEP